MDGKTANTMTKEQRVSMLRLVDAIKVVFGLNDTHVRMHNEFANKECPCFKKGEYLDMMANTRMFEDVKLIDCMNI